jgi:hypothetical protein
VSLFIYNRPHLTAKVWAAVRQIRPRRLLVVADAPVDELDAQRCRETQLVVSRVDWPCDVDIDVAPRHLGCGPRMSSGIAWVFSRVDRAIFLEDDTVPHPSFFWFCRELLDRYDANDNVMQIGGTNLLGSFDHARSYSFSKFTLPPWGWASWSRAWARYDYYMDFWERERDALALRLGESFPRWNEIATAHIARPVSWDLQWNATLWRYGGLSVVPSSNLISNIGWGSEATLTRAKHSRYGNMPSEACSFPLTHPRGFDTAFDTLVERELFLLCDDVVGSGVFEEGDEGSVVARRGAT